MFEDSLVESQNRIRTRSKWFAVGSFLAQAALLLVLILLPLFRPEALPRQSLERLLIAPPAPRSPAHVEARRAASEAASRRTLPSLQEQLLAPRTIPDRIATVSDQGPEPASPIGSMSTGDKAGIPGGVDLGSPAPTVVVARPTAPKSPLKVSSGVATGLLLRPIQPIYPAIAKTTRTQGTVVIEATISRQGRIENLRVIDGPQLLRQAAIDAVAAAQYRPYLLNGEPIEVQTTINIIFSLGG